MKDLPADQRPREKLLARGPAALSDAELLALLLRTGYKGTGVLAFATQLLERTGGFAGLLNADADALRSVKGLGKAKRAEVVALMECARRALAQQLADAPVFDNPQTVKDYLALHLGQRPSEVFTVLFLDSRLRLIKQEDLSHGTLNHTHVYPRDVLRRVLALNAAAVVLAHNHPSGVAEPSKADEQLTQSLKAALALIDVRVMDHMIVGRGHVVSMLERGLM
jgi:DNA repair protein RadC